MAPFFYILLLIPLLLVFYMRITKPKPRLPPGPCGLPIIGNLHQLGKLPHRSLSRLSENYGPLMHLKLGRIQTLIASSPEAAAEILKTHDLELCSRPPLVPLKKFSYGGLGMAFSPYDDQWKQLRKIATSEVFNIRRVQSFNPIREEEVRIFVQTIANSMSSQGFVNVSDMVLCLFNNITFREVFGRRVSEEGECRKSRLHDLLREIISLMGGFCVGDFFPGLEWLDVFTGSRARLEKSFRGMDELFEQEIQEHLEGDGRCIDDFLSVLLQVQGQKDLNALGFPLTRAHIKAVLMDMLTGGTDSSAATVEWGMTELVKNPRVMKKAQDEVREVIGNKGKVEESDLPQLQYLKLVIQEVLRLHPPPLLLPRECMEDCSIYGYDIPAKTRVYINAWAIGRDPKTWDDPETFWPERFENSLINYKGQFFQFIPFGGGRRICPGMSLGMIAIELAFANILYCFSWDLPEGMTKEDIDMEECFGAVTNKRTPLVLMAHPLIAM